MVQIKKIHVLVIQVFYSLLELSALALAENEYNDTILYFFTGESLVSEPKNQAEER